MEYYQVGRLPTDGLFHVHLGHCFEGESRSLIIALLMRLAYLLAQVSGCC
jgi:hypothetical protein